MAVRRPSTQAIQAWEKPDTKVNKNERIQRSVPNRPTNGFKLGVWFRFRCLKNRENHFTLNNDNRKQTTTAYNAIKRRACATRFFRLPKPGDSEDELRLRYIHSQYICPHRTKNRTIDTAVYVDCPQTASAGATTEAGFEPLSMKEKSLSFLDIKQSSIDSDDPAPNSSLTNHLEQSNNTSGLYSQSESFVRSASNVSSRSTGSMTFSIPKRIDAFWTIDHIRNSIKDWPKKLWFLIIGCLIKTQIMSLMPDALLCRFSTRWFSSWRVSAILLVHKIIVASFTR